MKIELNDNALIALFIIIVFAWLTLLIILG